MKGVHGRHWSVVLLCASFFLSWGSGGYGYYACRHHEALPSGSEGARSEFVSPTPPRGGGSTPERLAAASRGEHLGPCTCVGICPAGGGPPVDGVRTERPEIGHARLGRGVLRVRIATLARLLPYILPYANAPPVA